MGDTPDPGKENLNHPSETVQNALRAKATKIALSHLSDAIDFEIQTAARERRRADLTHNTAWYYMGSNGVGTTMRRLAWPEVKAMVETDNKIRMDAYEAYRLLCEQGVALPPSSPAE